MKNKFKVIAINRHRLGIDGNGVTTLVALNGCPLKCKHCLNKDVLRLNYKELTPEELINEIMIDYCYFLVTAGGITFGGGETLLHSKQIKEVRSILHDKVKINIETSLNVDSESLDNVIKFVDELIIDIKSLDSDIYYKYTGLTNEKVIRNLRKIESLKMQNKCKIRIPNIPEFTDEASILKTVTVIKGMGFNNIDRFDYVTEVRKNG